MADRGRRQAAGASGSARQAGDDAGRSARRGGSPRTRNRAEATADGIRHWPAKLVIFAALCVLPGLGIAHLIAAAGTGAWLGSILSAGYALVSLATLLLYAYDKRQARRQGPRLPERWLHLAELGGGWPGALVAQQVWRHKTRKGSYQIVFWFIVLVHQGLWLAPMLLARLAG